MQGPRQQPVPQRHDRLDDPGGARGRLRVPEVGLDRAQPQRPVAGTVLPVGGQERLRFDRVTEGRPGAVGLHGVHLGGRQPGVLQRGADDPLL